MRVLFRVAATLVIAIPVLLALMIVFALEARRGTAAPPETGASRSLQRGTSLGSPIRGALP
jgi:hypothetical protein